MLKLHLISVGKTKERWLEEAIQEYIKRLKGRITISFTWVLSNSELITKVSKERAVIALDPTGEMMPSEGFHRYLFNAFERGGSRLCLVIGGAEGLPKEIRDKYPLLSLSPMTMTHQMTRLLLIEQIYRASEIEHGSPYHK